MAAYLLFTIIDYLANLRFADDKDALAEQEQELEAMVENIDKAAQAKR